MRAARPTELKSAALPVIAAKVSEQGLSEWFPIPFEDITDPEATPEPSKGALVKLADGPYFVAYWGELSEQLTVRIPKATDPSMFLEAFFTEVPLPKSRILWRRSDARLPERGTTTRRVVASFRKRARPQSVVAGARTRRVAGSRRMSARKK
jgi:hypothetical protein